MAIYEYDSNELEKYKTLFIIRGLQTTGKSVIANYLTDYNVSANDYFLDENGNYKYRAFDSKKAHEWCFDTVEKFMTEDKAPIIAVHNTFSTKWEYMQYVELARENNYAVHVIETKTQFESDKHRVPSNVIVKIARRWEAITDFLFD